MLTDEQIEKGWRATFSTSNPFCPCNLKSFAKVVRWTEWALAATPEPSTTRREALFTGHCGASKDGECSKTWCPQNRDGEPAKSGRSCPLPDHEEA